MEGIKLKPCPFCGGKANIKLKSKGFGEYFMATFRVGCDECGYGFNEESRWLLDERSGQIKTYKNGYIDCIERWNRREDDDK